MIVTLTFQRFNTKYRELMRSLAMQGRQRAAEARQTNVQRASTYSKLYHDPNIANRGGSISSSGDQKEDMIGGFSTFDVQAVLDPKFGACVQFDGSWNVVGFRVPQGNKKLKTKARQGPLESKGVVIGDQLTAIQGRNISDPTFSIRAIINMMDEARLDGKPMQFSFARGNHVPALPLCSKSPPRQPRIVDSTSPVSPPNNLTRLGFISTPCGLWR